MPTTAFDALDRLVDLLSVPETNPKKLGRPRLLVDSDDIWVVDGGLRQDSPDNALCVGYTPDGLAADGEQVRQPGYSLTRRKESYDLTCTAFVCDGDADMREARTKAKSIYRAVEVALAADPRLSNGFEPLVELAVMGGRFVISQEQTKGGAEVVAQFTVRCEALIT